MRLLQISFFVVFAATLVANSPRWIPIRATVTELVDNRVSGSPMVPHGVNYGSVYVVLTIKEPNELEGKKVRIVIKESLNDREISKVWLSEALSLEIFCAPELLSDPRFSFYDTDSSVKNITETKFEQVAAGNDR